MFAAIDFTTEAWLWLYASAFLMLAELVCPGFVIFFFGLGAATVAAAKWAVPDLSASWQLALFSLSSILYLVVLRRWLKSVFMGDTDESQKIECEHVGRIGKVVKTVGADIPGRIERGDAEWSAGSSAEIPPGATVRVVGQNNLTLTVEAV